LFQIRTIEEANHR